MNNSISNIDGLSIDDSILHKIRSCDGPLVLTLFVDQSGSSIREIKPLKPVPTLEEVWLLEAHINYDTFLSKLKSEGYLQGIYLNASGTLMRELNIFLQKRYCIPALSNTKFFNTLKASWTLSISDRRSLNGAHKSAEAARMKLENMFPK